MTSYSEDEVAVIATAAASTMVFNKQFKTQKQKRGKYG